MTKKIISALLALIMLFMTACGDSSTAEDSKTVESAAESASDSSERESDSKPSGDWNAELITTGTETKKTDSTTAKGSDSETGATTTTKSASNDSKQEQPQGQQKPQSTQAQPRTTQGIPKTPVKPVQTTKATVKTTSKTTPKQNTTVDISKLSKLQQALYRVSKSYNGYNKQDLEIIRSELLAYGKSLYPKVPICTELHPLITKDGRYTDSFDEAVGGTNSSTEWYMPDIWGYYNYKTEAERIDAVKGWETRFKNQIKATLDDNARFGNIPTVWYITYGFESYGISWVCMTAFPEEWK